MQWRTATITPIFKKGISSDPGNYRPISLTSTCCKLLESLIKDVILIHCASNSIISKKQHGFLSRRSTDGNLLECINDWTLALSNRNSVGAVYVDFSKAFDSVCHTKLIAKLSAVGIGGNLLSWIGEFLRDRTHCTKVGSSISAPTRVLSGVPQGSVLGPLLFVLYII